MTEATKPQVIGDAIGMMTDQVGFVTAAMGHYSVYRRMRTNPTIALARAVATAPLRIASWSVRMEKGFEDEEVKEFIEHEMRGHWRSFLKNILLSLDYGWAPFEKVWKIDDKGRLCYQKLKPLLVDLTKILVDSETGLFLGFQNIAVNLPANKCFLYTHDMEAGNLYGRSRHENIRETAWTFWNQVMEKWGKYITKVSGIIPMIEYPEGQSQDASGSTIDNFEIAKKVLQNLGSGFGVTMPNTLIRWAEDATKTGVDLAKIKAWTISFLESKGQHDRGFEISLRHLESLMMRGWLVPERAAIEGQFGTKAESQVQGDLGMMIADLLYEEILEAINWYVVNPLLVYNFGAAYENQVKLERSGPGPELKTFLIKVMEKVLTDPGNIDLFLRWMDIDALIDALGLPKKALTEPATEVSTEEQAKKDMNELNTKLQSIIA